MEQVNADTVIVELTKGELYQIVFCTMIRAQKLISIRAPKVMCEEAIRVTEKLNEILNQSGEDCYEEEKFTELKEALRYEDLQ